MYKALFKGHGLYINGLDLSPNLQKNHFSLLSLGKKISVTSLNHPNIKILTQERVDVLNKLLNSSNNNLIILNPKGSI